ncbi:MAG: hypothetical protein GY679_01505 [Mycoplasma sp.]|nr:hypothetical protein [Mycoplasma sp.]
MKLTNEELLEVEVYSKRKSVSSQENERLRRIHGKTIPELLRFYREHLKEIKNDPYPISVPLPMVDVFCKKVKCITIETSMHKDTVHSDFIGARLRSMYDYAVGHPKYMSKQRYGVSYSVGVRIFENYRDYEEYDWCTEINEIYQENKIGKVLFIVD